MYNYVKFVTGIECQALYSTMLEWHTILHKLTCMNDAFKSRQQDRRVFSERFQFTQHGQNYYYQNEESEEISLSTKHDSQNMS